MGTVFIHPFVGQGSSHSSLVEFRKIQHKVIHMQVVMVVVTQLPQLRHLLGSNYLVPVRSISHLVLCIPQASTTDIVDTTYECSNI